MVRLGASTDVPFRIASNEASYGGATLVVDGAYSDNAISDRDHHFITVRGCLLDG